MPNWTNWTTLNMGGDAIHIEVDGEPVLSILLNRKKPRQMSLRMSERVKKTLVRLRKVQARVQRKKG